MALHTAVAAILFPMPPSIWKIIFIWMCDLFKKFKIEGMIFSCSYSFCIFLTNTLPVPSVTSTKYTPGGNAETLISAVSASNI